MVATRELARLVDLVARRGAKLVLVGDDRQLGAIRAPGGMFAALADSSARSSSARRTASPTPGKPPRSAQLRAVTAAGSTAFGAHGRIHGGTETQANRDCSAAGGPPTKPDATRSCSPTITPPRAELATRARGRTCHRRRGPRRAASACHTDVGSQDDQRRRPRRDAAQPPAARATGPAHRPGA